MPDFLPGPVAPSLPYPVGPVRISPGFTVGGGAVLGPPGPPGVGADPESLRAAAAEAVEDYLTDHPVATIDDLAAHIEAPTPHPAYDETPDLALIFENRLI